MFEKGAVLMISEPGLEVCEEHVVHTSTVRKAGEHMPEGRTLDRLADLFKLFADPTRVRILCALFESEMCVCDIAALLGTTQSSVSHHLRTLKQAKLVKYRRQGKTALYSLADTHVTTIIGQGMEHITE